MAVENYIPRKVYYRLRKTYPAFRWLMDVKSERVGEAWKDYPDRRVRIWGNKQQWSVVVDDKGGTVYGPDGDAVYWEDPGE